MHRITPNGIEPYTIEPKFNVDMVVSEWSELGFLCRLMARWVLDEDGLFCRQLWVEHNSRRNFWEDVTDRIPVFAHKAFERWADALGVPQILRVAK